MRAEEAGDRPRVPVVQVEVRGEGEADAVVGRGPRLELLLHVARVTRVRVHAVAEERVDQDAGPAAVHEHALVGEVGDLNALGARRGGAEDEQRARRNEPTPVFLHEARLLVPKRDHGSTRVARAAGT